MKKRTIKNVIWKEGRYYVAQCLNFDVSSFGLTRQNALKNIKEAIGLYLEGSSRTKIPIVKFPEVVDTAI